MSQTIVDLPESSRGFATTLHDWCVVFTGGHYLWPQYGTTLVNTITDACQKQSIVQRGWLQGVMTQTMSSGTLLYRHYLVQNTLDQDIGFDKNSIALHQLIGSTLIDPIVFDHLYVDSLWPTPVCDTLFVNQFRKLLPSIKSYLYDLSMQEENVVDHIIRGHAQIFSLSLLYGLYLALVVANYEQAIDPHPALARISHCLRDTIENLKGAICCGKNHWH